jgi:hypothetical protein
LMFVPHKRDVKTAFMKRIFLLSLAFVVFIISCRKSSDYSNHEYEVEKQWNLFLESRNVIPVPAGRADTGHLILQVLSNQAIQYEYKVDLMGSDSIVGAGIYAGDPTTNGALVLDLKPKTSNSYATGILYNIRQSLLDSLRDSTNQYYFSVNSRSLPTGALRVQINSNIIFSADVVLTGANEVPPVTTTSTGLAVLRLTSNKVLYSKVSVSNVEPGDVFNMAHIHTGAPGVNGPILIGLVSSATEFGITKSIALTDAQYNSLLNDRLYVNAHSILFPAGKIRGQLR